MDESLLVVGFRPYKLVKAAGHRTEPPMSEPIPIADPCMATIADSPPDEPPGESLVQQGFLVLPMMLFQVSRCMIACGWEVRAWYTAPIL